MCYGMGCEWENSYGECTAPRSVLRCPNEEREEIGEEEIEGEEIEWEEIEEEEGEYDN